MKKISIALLALSTMAFTAAKLTNWTVNNEEAKITFTMPEQGAEGEFKKMNAEIVFDANNLDAAKIKATVEAASIDTKNEGRDEHLKNPDFFDVEKYPIITFTSDKFSKTENGYNVTGKLNMKDSTKTIDMPFTFDDKGDKGLFKGSFTIFAGDYGVTKKSKSGKDKVVITLEVSVNKK